MDFYTPSIPINPIGLGLPPIWSKVSFLFDKAPKALEIPTWNVLSNDDADHAGNDDDDDDNNEDDDDDNGRVQ